MKVIINKKEFVKKELDSKDFGLSIGLVSTIFYFGCVLSMIIFGSERVIYFLNLIFHGLDFNSIIRMNIPLLETLLGAIATFIVCGGFGYLSAFVYNKMNGSTQR